MTSPGRRVQPPGWSLRTRLRRGLIGLGVVVAAVIAVAVLLLVQVRDSQRQVINRYFTAVNLANTRYVEQVDADAAVRGYALTTNPATLRPFTALRSRRYRAGYTTLTGLLPGDGVTPASLRQWEVQSQRWLTGWATPTVAEVKQRGGAAVTNAQVLKGKQLFDTSRAAFGRFHDDLVAKRNAASDGLKLRTTLLFIADLVAAVGIALAGLGLWLALRRWVVGPLAALGSETLLVRSGQLDHPVIAGGPEEVRDLGTAVEEMRRALVRQLTEVEHARAEIEAAQQVLAAQAQELERSNRDLEQFAYVASHDLQEPLRKVASFCQMLDRRYSGQLDERADQYIAFAVDGAKRMQQLINDLLSFSRVGRISDGFSDVDLDVCYERALENLAALQEQTEAVVTHDPLPHVMGERGLLIQLFQNLIGNAIKFRGEARPRVHIAVQEQPEFWEFGCIDNGIGIAPQYAERIFVIFQRLHGKEEFSGTGIGLALCKRIVEHHGGAIWLDTASTDGATFRWTLPKVRSDVGETGTP